MAKGPGKGASPPPPPRPNPLDRPVMTFAAPHRPDPLGRPVLSFQTYAAPVSPRVRVLDLTAHVLHEEHLPSVVAHALTLSWAPEGELKARPANPAVAERLQGLLREVMGQRAPSLHNVSGPHGDGEAD